MWIELKLKKKHKAKQTMKNEDNRSFQKHITMEVAL